MIAGLGYQFVQMGCILPIKFHCREPCGYERMKTITKSCIYSQRVMLEISSFWGQG